MYAGIEEELAALNKALPVAKVVPVVGVRAAVREPVELPETDDVRELARAATPMAIRALIDIVGDEGASVNARIAAATALLDRGHGKPHQSASVTGDMRLTVVCAIPSAPNSSRGGVGHNVLDAKVIEG